MSDDNDDLDAFAKLFGATPETPAEGLMPPADPWAAAPAAPTVAADPLGWLLSDAPAPAAFPVTDEYTRPPATPTTATATPSEPTQVLPTRRSLAADAARASRDQSRRNLIILGSIGSVVAILVVVLILVLVAKNGSSGSPDALLRQGGSPSPSASSTTTPTPTPTPTPSETLTPIPTPTPTPTQVRTVAPPSAPTVTANVAGQVTCTGGTPTTINIAYTTTNAATLNLMSSDGSVNTTVTPAASGTISSVLYQCDGSGESYTLTAYSSDEGVTPATATVTPTPVGQ